MSTIPANPRPPGRVAQSPGAMLGVPVSTVRLALDCAAALGLVAVSSTVLLAVVHHKLPALGRDARVGLATLSGLILLAAFTLSIAYLLRIFSHAIHRVEADRSRAETETRWLAQLQAENPNPVLRVSSDGRIAYANEAAQHLLLAPWRCTTGQPVPREWFALVLKALRAAVPIEAEVSHNRTRLLLTLAPVEQGPHVNIYARDITDRKRAERTMHESYRLLQAIIGGTDDRVFVKDLGGRYLMANRAACVALGRPLGDILGHTDRALQAAAEADAIGDSDRQVLAHGAGRVQEETITRGAATRTFLTTKGPIRNHRGQVVGLFGISRDITDRKIAEEEILDANRCLRAMTACRQALMHATSEDEILRDTCRIIVEVAGYRMAWVGFAEDDAERTLRRAAFAGCENGYLNKLRLTWGDDTPTGQGPAGRATRTGLPVAVNDVATDEAFRPWRAAALARGYRSAIAIPLLPSPPETAATTDRRAFGIIAIYSQRPRAFDTAEVQLLTELADDLAFGILSMRARQERHRAQAALAASEEQFRSERAMAEQALRESEEKYRELVENANSIILKLDRRGNIIFLNEFAEKFFGYRKEELIGRNVVGTIVPPVESTSGRDLADMIARVMENPAGFHSNANENMTKDGRRIWVSWTNREIYDSTGELVGVLSIGNDMTENIRREQQLRQAQKLEAIGLLAGGVAHDFRNHLTVIRGYSEMLLQLAMVSGRARDYVQEIVKAADRSTNLTNELLSFSRKQILRPQVVGLNGVLNDMAKSLTRLTGEDVRLTVMTADNLSNVKVDVAQFQEGIVNLVVNARDAMPKGGRLVIETSNVALDEAFARDNVGAVPGPHVCVTVRDTGEGMGPETIKQIFDPFFTTKPPGRGTGLGLPMVYGFLKQSHGHITVESQLGHGTTMRMYFPAVEAPAEAAPAAPVVAPLSRGQGTVLVVEDEASIRRMLVQTLKNCGYSVLAAGSARRALTMVRDYPGRVHLLLTDVIMPGADGVDLAARVRSLRPDIQVVYMSGYPDGVLDRHGVRDATMNLLVKPFTSQAIAEMVTRALRKTAS